MEKLSYNVTIPSFEKTKTLCDWKPSIVIFLGSLGQGTVLIKFSQASSLLNVSSYEVTFIPLSELKMQTVFQVAADQNKSMLLLKFHPAFSDIYNLSITPSSFKGSGCHNSEMIPIPVGFFKYGKEMRIIMYACIALFAVGVLFLLKYLCNYVNNLDSAFEPHVLLMHAINYDEEIKLASIFSDYLSIQHGCRVSSIYGDGIDPEKWCAEKYRECNVILIILSEGLFKTSVLHTYCNQLIIANRILRNQMSQPGSDFEKKKIAMICFPFSNEDHIPERMKLMTETCFMLPTQIGSFLCFLFGCTNFFKCIKHHLNFLLSKINASKEYNELIKAIEAVQFVVEQNSHSKNLNETRIITDNEDVTDDSDPSLFLEKNLEDFSHECNLKTFIDSLVHGSFTCIAHEPDNGTSHQIESKDALEFPNSLELISNSHLEIDFILPQMVNKTVGYEEPDQQNVTDFSSLLDQINKSDVDDSCQDSEKSGLLNHN